MITHLPVKKPDTPNNTSIDAVPVMTNTGWEDSGIKIDDGVVVAPEGFKVNSGGFEFGETISIQESSGILVVDNQIKNKAYQVVDYYSPTDAPTSLPKYFKLQTASFPFVVQATRNFGIMGDCSVSFVAHTTMRWSGFWVDVNNHQTSMLARITNVTDGVVLKHIPTKTAWDNVQDSQDLLFGYTYIGFGKSPLIINEGTEILVEFTSDNPSVFSLVGASTGEPYFEIEIQEGSYESLVDESLLNNTVADYQLTTEAFSGDYNDLLNKPTIPTQASDIGAAAQNHTHTTGDVSGLAAVATSGSYNDLLNKPIIPLVKRVETFLGVTDGNGNYSVTYSTPFSVTPDVQVQIQVGTPSQVARVTSSTVNGFTVNVTNRASVSLLGVEVLLAATTPVSGASVSVLVTSR